ncbi:MAG TPA: tetratricopeptide repeat protein [Planctomycetota bacterium]|nr:tetratricopeptide repeat protein [Planctomycetota bacterium]
MDLSKHLEKAEDAVRRKNFDHGIGLYRQLLDVSPGDYQARLGLHRAYARKHESKPTPAWVARVQGAPALAMARTYRAAKSWRKEADALEGYLLLDPLNVEGNLSLGLALERADLPDAALAVYEGLAEAVPSSADAWKRAAALLAAKNDVRRALESLQKALEIDPRDQEAIKARKDLAAQHALVGGGLESATHSRQLIADKDRAAELERGQRLLRTAEEIDAEIERLMGTLAESPGDPRVLGELAKLHERKQDLPAALDCVERALERAPEDFDLKTRRGALKSRLLEQEVEKLRARADSDPAAREALARAEQEKLAFEVDEARSRAAEHPTDLSLKHRLGKLLLKKGDVDAAIGELQKAIDDPRVRVEALLSLGHAFFRKELFDLARKQLERALELVPASSPKWKETLYNLGVISERAGAGAEALGFYLRIYEIDIGYRDVADKLKKLRG